ncbi:MAG: CcmD family protein [Bacteroidetes bacterium]|nr:CcmD family protein [Bacteroidota bacterium]
MIKRFYTFLFVLISFFASAQTPQMADTFREEGKIYVVISVIGIVFIALVFFLIYLERKVKKLEEELSQKSEVKS